MFDRIFSDFAEIGISLLVAAVLLFGVSQTALLSRTFHEKQLENQIVSEEIQETRKNMFYNNTHVYQQDIVSLILRYKNDRTIIVRLRDGNTYEWSLDTQSSDYKVSDIGLLLPKDSIYDADLIYGPNLREVIGYTFVECDLGDCGHA